MQVKTSAQEDFRERDAARHHDAHYKQDYASRERYQGLQAEDQQLRGQSRERDREEDRRERRRYDEERRRRSQSRYEDMPRERDRDRRHSREPHKDRRTYYHKPDRAWPGEDARRGKRSRKDYWDRSQPSTEDCKHSRVDELCKRETSLSSSTSSRDPQALRSRSQSLLREHSAEGRRVSHSPSRRDSKRSVRRAAAPVSSLSPARRADQRDTKDDQRHTSGGSAKGSKPGTTLPSPLKRTSPAKHHLSVAVQSLAQIPEEDVSDSQDDEPLRIVFPKTKPGRDEAAQKLSGPASAVQDDEQNLEQLPSSKDADHPGRPETTIAASAPQAPVSQMGADNEAPANVEARQRKLPAAALNSTKSQEMPSAEPISDISTGLVAAQGSQPEGGQFGDLPEWMAGSNTTGQPSHDMLTKAQQTAPQIQAGIAELLIYGNDSKEEMAPAANTQFQATARQQGEQEACADGVSAQAEKPTGNEAAMVLQSHSLEDDSSRANTGAAIPTATLEPGRLFSTRHLFCDLLKGFTRR